MYYRIEHTPCLQYLTKMLEATKKLGIRPPEHFFIQFETERILSEEEINDIEHSLCEQHVYENEVKEHLMVSKTKKLIIDTIECGDYSPPKSFKKLIKTQVNQDYDHVSKCFTRIMGRTVKHFINETKIEMVKLWLKSSDTKGSEMAHKLNFSDFSHLTKVFKKYTGLTMTEFKHKGM
ncbi:MAG: helix-turn-helix domain-containing protein [Bacteroidota bacterium]